MNVTIFGAGQYGTALGQTLQENGHAVNYFDPAKYPDQSMTALLADANAMVLTTPSLSAPKLLLFLPRNLPLICATKGFLSLEPFLPFPQFSMLSGGAFAADLIARKPTTLTATSGLAGQLFANNWLAIEYTTDTLGVMLCGSLKNIYAIGAGLYNLAYGTQAFTDFIAAAQNEIRLILATNGCNPTTAELSCGINDLVITCASPASRNYQLGEKLRTDPNFKVEEATGTIEGLSAIRAMYSTKSFTKPDGVTVLNQIIERVIPPVVPEGKKNGK